MSQYRLSSNLCGLIILGVVIKSFGLNTASAVTFVVKSPEVLQHEKESQYRLSSNLCGLVIVPKKDEQDESQYRLSSNLCGHFFYYLFNYYNCLNTASAVTFVVIR